MMCATPNTSIGVHDPEPKEPHGSVIAPRPMGASENDVNPSSHGRLALERRHWRCVGLRQGMMSLLVVATGP
jgi:hypothetical protein